MPQNYRENLISEKEMKDHSQHEDININLMYFFLQIISLAILRPFYTITGAGFETRKYCSYCIAMQSESSRLCGMFFRQKFISKQSA